MRGANWEGRNRIRNGKVSKAPLEEVVEDNRRWRLCGGLSPKGEYSLPTTASRQWVLNQAQALNFYSQKPRFWVEDQDGNIVYGQKVKLSWLERQWGKVLSKMQMNGNEVWLVWLLMVLLVLMVGTVLAPLWYGEGGN